MEQEVSKSGFSRSKIVLTFVLIDLISKIFIALKPLKYIDGMLIPDDAYLALTISRNISKGLGPLYGSELTNGFQPLYVFLISPFFLLFPNDLFTPIHIALVILAVFDAFTLFYLFKLLALYTKNIIPVLYLGVSWLITTSILKNSMNGLETAISVFFIVYTLYHFTNYKKNCADNSKNMFKIGLMCGLAMIARIDNIFMISGIIIVVVLNRKTVLYNNIKNAIFICCGAIIAVLPWLLYLYFYGIEIFPISGRAVRYLSLAQVNHSPTWANWYSKSIETAGSVIYNNNSVQILILLFFILLLIVFYKKFKTAYSSVKFAVTVEILLLMSIFLLIAYSMYIFAFWFYGRYFYPLTLFFIITNTLLITLTVEAILSKKIKLLLFIVLTIGLLAGNIYKDNIARIYLAGEHDSRVNITVGLWCSMNFSSGTVIGSSQTGALGYFANNLKVVNLDGVVNSKCFESLVNKRNISYIKEQKIKYVIGWKGNINFIKTESLEYKESDLTLLGPIPGLSKSAYQWYIYEVNY